MVTVLLALETAYYAQMALQQVDPWTDLPSQVMVGKLRHYLDVTTKIISQTERRVLRRETVPAHEKVLSLFEEHTDIIKKKRRETVFGHKLSLTGGASGLMLDGEVVRGNPNDAAQFRLPAPVEPVYCGFSTLLRTIRSRKNRLYG